MILSLLPSLLHATSSVLGIFSVILFPPNSSQSLPNLLSLEGVIVMFQDPSMIFMGWVHYLVFDLLIGGMIVQDSIG